MVVFFKICSPGSLLPIQSCLLSVVQSSPFSFLEKLHGKYVLDVDMCWTVILFLRMNSLLPQLIGVLPAENP